MLKTLGAVTAGALLAVSSVSIAQTSSRCQYIAGAEEEKCLSEERAERAVGGDLKAQVIPGYAGADDKAGKATRKITVNHDRVRALEAYYKPGDVAPSAMRPFRVVRALKGGTMEITSLDGKREQLVWADGETKLLGPDEFSVKNIGNSDVHLYAVEVK
jgi:hypothetical protein